MTSEEDTRRRPVVFHTHAEPAAGSRRRPLRVLAGATLVLAALAGATGVALGGSAVWTGVGPNVPNNAPLWPVPPTPITPTNQPALAGNSTSTTNNPTTHDSPATHGSPATTASPATTGDRQRGKGTSGGSPTTSGSSGRGGSSGHG
ncbi:MAG TPA: hypothetical protein VGL06_04690 [Pseudonocardiaceae bacterium]|jgi:hypothetical protein